MGEVYLARDPVLDRPVAIKLLPAVSANDPDRLRRFEQEARATAALEHPRILAIHDIGQLGDRPFIVMEYVRGETLSAYMRRERPPLARALEIGIEIANALTAAHHARIVHRDLKPANVMVTADGHIKVLDFGLAKFLVDPSATTLDGHEPAQTRIGQLMGTPAYMSPEQLLGIPVDQRTDVYSLGLILFELVTGKRPFEGDPSALLRHAALTAPMPTPREVDPTVPPGVSDVIAHAVARDPLDRFQTAAELEVELKRLLLETQTGIASVASPSRSDQPGDSQTNRRQVFRYAVWALLGAIAIGAATIPFIDRLRPPEVAVAERPVIAVLPLANVSGDASKEYLGIGIADALTTSLARLSSISVVSRSTMLDAGLSTRALDEIARELGATMLVRGSIQQAGERLRVNATLLTPEGRVVWSGDAEAPLGDLFSMQNQLAESLLAALRITVSTAERQRLARAPTRDAQALDDYWQGLALLDRPDDANFEAAVAHFRRAAARDPQFSLAFAALGEAYRRRGVRTNDAALMESAGEAVSEALRLDPEQPEVRLSLAGVYRSTGRSAVAIDEVRRVLAVQPENDDAHRLLGELLAGMGRPQEAREELLRAVSLRPQYWRNREAIGLFLYRTGRVEEAIDAFTRVAELKPSDSTPLQQLGAMYLASGDRVRARQHFERSIQLNPNSGAFTNLGTIAYAEGRYEDAVHAYEEAVRLAPARALLRRNLGDAYQKLQRKAEAKTAYLKAIELAEEALKVNPNDSTTVSQLGVYYAKAAAPAEAERYASRAVQMNPASPEVLYRRAVVLALIGQSDAAIGQLSEAIEKGYAVHLAREDDDLASLRPLRAFQLLLAASKPR